MMSKPVCLALLVLSSYTLASPLPQAPVVEEEGRALTKKTAETTAELAQDIIASISSIFTKTGELVKSINDETYGHEDITRHSQSVSDLGSSLDEDTAEALTDGYTMLQENLPTLKNHVKTVLDKVPGIHETIQDGIDSTPDRERMKSYVSDFFKSLPESWSHPALDEARDTVLETIDSLPTKDFVKDQVKSVADTIPSSDYVHEKIDDYVEVLGSAVDEFNETDTDVVDA
jgi:hypothetical protein